MTSFTDDFQRPNAPTLGSGWASYTAGFHITSGAAVCDTTATNAAQRTLDLSTGDHSGSMVIGNTYGGSFTGVCARMPVIGTSGTTTGAYYLLVLSGSTGTAFSLRRKEVNSTTLTTLTPTSGGNSSVDARLDGSVWRIETEQSGADVLLRGYVNNALVVSAIDTGPLVVPATQRRVGIYTGGTTGPDLRIGSVSGADLTVVAVDTTPPTVPNSVTATADTSTSVTVRWAASTDTGGVASYRIRRDGVDLVGATALTGLSYSDTGVSAGTHTYTVSAVDAAGNRSAESSAASVTLTPTDTSPPAVPTSVTATAGVNKVTVAWSPVVAGDLAGYRVYRWTAAAPTHVLVSSPTTASFSDSGVSVGTTYSYAVRSIDQAGNLSAESATVSAAPTAPSGGGGGVVLQMWNGSALVPVTVAGVWNGSSLTPVVSVQVAP